MATYTYLFPATVRMKVYNTPCGVQQGLHDGEFMVVRRSEEDATLWYYGVYETYEKAQKAAIEIRNGLVVQLGGEEEKKWLLSNRKKVKDGNK